MYIFDTRETKQCTTPFSAAKFCERPLTNGQQLDKIFLINCLSMYSIIHETHNQQLIENVKRTVYWETLTKGKFDKFDESGSNCQSNVL